MLYSPGYDQSNNINRQSSRSTNSPRGRANSQSLPSHYKTMGQKRKVTCNQN